MKMKLSLKTGLTAFMVLLLAATVYAKDVADAVYHNGKIYTMDRRQPWAEAVARKLNISNTNP